MANWKKVVVESSSGNIAQKAATAGTADNITSQGALATLGSVAAGQINSNAVTTAKLSTSAVTNAKLANDAVDADKISSNAVTTAKILNEAVTAAKIESGCIESQHLEASIINDSQLIADDVINSQHYVNGSIDAAHLASDSVTNAKVADDAIGLAELSATGTPGSGNFLRGDNTWAAAGTMSNFTFAGNSSATIGAASTQISDGETFTIEGASGLTSHRTAEKLTISPAAGYAFMTSGSQSFSGIKSFGSNVIIAGDLTVSGSTITTNTETLEIADNTLILNSDLTGVNVDTGFVFERGSTTSNKTFFLDVSANKMVLSDNASAAIGGTYQADMMTVRIDGAAINTSSTEVPIGHMQYHNGELYLRVEN